MKHATYEHIQKLYWETNDTNIEDEAILTDEPITTGKWAPIGKQPVQKTNSKGSHKLKVIFGACNSKTGDVIYYYYVKYAEAGKVSSSVWVVIPTKYKLNETAVLYAVNYGENIHSLLPKKLGKGAQV